MFEFNYFFKICTHPLNRFHICIHRKKIIYLLLGKKYCLKWISNRKMLKDAEKAWMLASTNGSRACQHTQVDAKDACAILHSLWGPSLSCPAVRQGVFVICSSNPAVPNIHVESCRDQGHAGPSRCSAHHEGKEKSPLSSRFQHA